MHQRLAKKNEPLTDDKYYIMFTKNMEYNDEIWKIEQHITPIEYDNSVSIQKPTTQQQDTDLTLVRCEAQLVNGKPTVDEFVFTDHL